MKILFVTNEFSHPDLRPTGGIGRFYKELSKELVSKKHQIFVLGANHKKFKKIDEGVSFHYNKKINFISEKLALVSLLVNRFLVLIRFISFLRTHKVDVIEVNEPIIAYLISFFNNNTPIVLRQHGMHSVLSVMYGSPISKFYFFLEKKAHYRADKIISVSRYVKQLILELYGQDLHVDVVYNGVEVEKQEFCCKKDTRTLLYVAALSKKKGYLDLVNIFNEVNRIDKTINLIIIGRESEFNYESLNFTNSALNNIKYFGYLDYDELKKYYITSNLFLNFTKGETFGLTTIEAMSYKLPVVMSNVGVAKEIVKDGVNGYVVETDDVSGVLEAVMKIMDDISLQERMGNSGQEIVNKYFSNTLLGKMTLKTYKQVNGGIK